jgi:hypothetical protein
MSHEPRAPIAPDQVRPRQDLTVATASSWDGPTV